MIIFLDFDNTLFAADEFIDYIDEHPDFARILSQENPSAPFERYLFDDVHKFLKDARAQGYKLVIASSAIDPEMQSEKIVATGIAPHVDDIIVTPSGKSQAIKEWITRHGEDLSGHYFVDDMPVFINEVKKELPGSCCVRIERRGLTPFLEMKNRDMSDLVISSLDDLRPSLGLSLKNHSQE